MVLRKGASSKKLATVNIAQSGLNKIQDIHKKKKKKKGAISRTLKFSHS